MQLKKSKTYKEQVEILRNKGLKINDSGNVISFLNHVNYYRFSGYFLPFISKTDKKFHDGTSFEQLENIYHFDSELRKLIMGTIDEIEIYLKSQISYYHSQKYDAEGYTDSANYNSKHNHNAFLQRVSTCWKFRQVRMEGSRFCEVNSAYISGLVGMPDKLFVGFGGKL